MTGRSSSALLAFIGCLLTGSEAMAQATPPAGPPTPQLANPASTHCIESGGVVRMERLPSGGQYGVCVFVDDRQCEEWALFRRECPVGGLRVTGYITPAARYCAITGGRYSITGRSGAADEQGDCTFSDGETCDAAAYLNGSCMRRRQ
ncbi:MAG: DUF333 domain-containing protein [Reyranellaceae bacterium]